jgi:hypothetical protein
MTKETQPIPSPKALIALESLRVAVAKALDRKRRLGQYAVMWENGAPVLIGEDAPPGDASPGDASATLPADPTLPPHS